MTHGKTYNKSPRRINLEATRSKTNSGTTALERSVEQTTGGGGGGVKALLQLANFTLVYLLDNIFIRFGTKLYRQTIGIPMGTNCAPLVADLFLFCYERNFMKSLSRENQADIIEAFNSTSRYLDDLLNIDNIYFDQMVDRIYPTELQLNRVNSSDTEAPFLDLNLCISNGTVSTKIYDKRDDFDFDIANFPFVDGDAYMP